MTSTAKPLNAVLIGLGMGADAHVHALAKLQAQVRLKGVYARNQQKALQYAEKVQGICGAPCALYPSLQAIVEDEQVDFVIMVTPPNARLELVELFAAAKMPILMEKPIERTSDAALQIVEHCESANVPLGIVLQHRFRPASLKLKSLMQEKVLGELGLVNVSAPLWRFQSYYDEPGRGSYARDGGGVLISQAIHTLDLMLALAGEVDEVQAMSHTSIFHQMESEDFVCAGLRFKNGAVGSLFATTANYPGGTECITLHFEKAVAKLDRGMLELNWRDGRLATFGQSNDVADAAEAMVLKSGWHASVIADFAEAVLAQRDPSVTGREALKVHHLIDALLASSEQKKAVCL